MKVSFVGLAVLATLFSSPRAYAQQQTPSSGPLQMRKWDLSSSFGLNWVNETSYYFGRDGGSVEDIRTSLTVGVGRYFSPHLKADVSATVTNGAGTFDIIPSERVPGGYEYHDRSGHPATLSLGATYQFFENIFAHPFVSGGANIVWLPERRFVTVVDGRFRPVGRFEESDTAVHLRPFVAAGFKSYFNERAFMRSEIQLAFGPGVPATTARVGVGVDF